MAEQQSTFGKLFKSMGIYSIGVLGTRIITFLLIPFYTYFIARPADYGYYDLCLNICMLLTPVVTLQMREGAFRFLLTAETSDAKTAIITFIYKTLAASVAATIALTVIASWFTHIPYLGYTAALLILMSIYEVVCQIARGLNDNKVYVTSNIILALLTAMLSAVFIVWLQLDIKGIFLAGIVARIVCIGFIEIKIKTLSGFFNPHASTAKIGHSIMRYSLPLIPFAVCWWLTTSSDRFFINHYLGLDVNGIYAVAIRFGGIIQSLAIIFYQAWQETAITHSDDSDRNSLYSKVFNYYIHSLCILFLLYAVLLKVNYGWIVSANYRSSLIYIFPVGITAIINALASSFFVPGYQSQMDSTHVFKSTAITAVANVVLNFALVPVWGICGILATSFISYSGLLAIRCIDFRRYFKIKLYKTTLVPIALCALCSIPFYFSHTPLLDLTYLILSLAIAISTLPRTFRQLIKQKLSPRH